MLAVLDVLDEDLNGLPPLVAGFAFSIADCFADLSVAPIDMGGGVAPGTAFHWTVLESI
jgi:hypothetical protein